MSSIQVQRIRAIGLTVSDIERSRNFYTQALGFQLVSDVTADEPEYSQAEGVPNTAIRIVTLKLGDEYIELMQYLTLKGEPIPDDSQSNDLWFQHFAIAVDDMDRAHSHLHPFLTESISPEPQTIPLSNQASAGIRAFKFRDPDRHPLEIIWFPPDKGQDKWHQTTDRDGDRLFLGIDHSAIAITDTERSLRFYRDLLGMRLDGGSLNEGETQARLDDLPDAKVRVTPLRPAQGGVGIELLDYLIPNDARPRPNHWRSCDIAHLQVELVVNNLEQAVAQLRQQDVRFSAERVKFTGSKRPFRQCCLVKDPSGHALLLIEE
jgi:catechol 2,3-dioxygenase-like lactoylglutathione lyase family enzyme